MPVYKNTSTGGLVQENISGMFNEQQREESKEMRSER